MIENIYDYRPLYSFKEGDKINVAISQFNNQIRSIKSINLALETKYEIKQNCHAIILLFNLRGYPDNILIGSDNAIDNNSISIKYFSFKDAIKFGANENKLRGYNYYSYISKEGYACLIENTNANITIMNTSPGPYKYIKANQICVGDTVVVLNKSINDIRYVVVDEVEEYEDLSEKPSIQITGVFYREEFNNKSSIILNNSDTVLLLSKND